jgi:RNA recognition motif-containing protein
MSKKLFVGNLSFNAQDSELKEAFGAYGEVTEVAIIKDKYSGRSKGFGFVTFADDAAADKAVVEMHEKEFQGRKLTVNEAKPMEERPKREFRREY